MMRAPSGMASDTSAQISSILRASARSPTVDLVEAAGDVGDEARAGRRRG